MPFLHMTPFISQVRLYDEPDGYARRIPYKAIVTVTHMSDRMVYLSGAIGELGPEAFPALLELLRSQGVTEVVSERHGRMKTRSLVGAANIV